MTSPHTIFLPSANGSAASSIVTERGAITAQVRKVAEPDRIYLLGTVAAKKRITNIFTTDIPSCHYTAHYLLLVLESTSLEAHEVQERIESGCKPIIPVSVIVLKTGKFAEWLSASHPFATAVTTRAEQWYSNNAVSLPAATPLSREARQGAARSICNTSTARITSFLAGAELFRIRTEYSMAAFMLHQATECLLRTALHVLMGYYCNTHSLDKLSRFAGFLLWRLPGIFERHKPAGEALFQRLQKAYIETRYRDDYKITRHELDALFTKVEQLHDHVKEAIINNLVEVL